MTDSDEKKDVTPSVIITSHIPKNAIKVHYSCDRASANIHVWQGKRGIWYWDALGNGGEDRSQEGAMREARQWVKFGQ